MSSQPALAFTIGTQNLYHYGTRLEERKVHLKSEIDQIGVPEIMGFQETARWVNKKFLFDFFCEYTGYTGIYHNTNEYWVMNDGVALVSSTKNESLKSYWLPETERFSAQAINTGVFLTHDSGRIFVVNAHLSPKGKNKARRVAQMRFILDVVRQQGDLPTVIVGDLNDSYDSEALKVLRDAGYVDVLEGKGATWDPGTNLNATKTGSHSGCLFMS